MTNKITNLINKNYNMKLTKDGKKIINKWLLEEFETIYYAQRQLDSDDAIMDFINDMLMEKNIKINELCSSNDKTNKPSIRKKINKNESIKHFKYCPYCGEYIEFK